VYTIKQNQDRIIEKYEEELV